MKTILVHTWGHGNGRLFDPNARDGTSEPAIFLRERLRNLGYSLETSDDHPIKDCAWVFFYDGISVWPYHGLKGMVRLAKTRVAGRPCFRNLYDECMRNGSPPQKALFLWEPPSTSPINSDAQLHDLFPIIFTWNDALVDGRRFFKIHHPQPERFPDLPTIHFAEKKLLVNISANKYSHHPRELYTARRAAIRHFERGKPNDFDLYGVGWDRPAHPLARWMPLVWHPYPSYRGTVRHKWEVFPKYRFSICYENIRDEPGYVTEKIFDSMRAGCVPIYLGASNIAQYVSTDAFIDRRRFRSEQELDDYIVGMSDRDYSRFQSAIKDYLAGEQFVSFLPSAFSETVTSVLGLL